MDGDNYVGRLNEYAQKTCSVLLFEDLGSDGPDHSKTFTLRAVIDGHVYPNGVGKNKKEAKQNAAKQALIGLKLQDPVDSVETSVENNSAPLYQRSVSQPNLICWLNEHGHKNRITIKAVESTRMGPNNTTQCCYFVVGGKEYPSAYGRTKKEAKEEAARLVYNEIFGSQTTGTADENESSTSGQPNGQLNDSVSSISDKMTKMNMSSKETNFIGIINHYCQKTNRHHDFMLVRKTGLSHCPIFFYKVVIDGKEYPEGEGKTAKEAKQNAAHLAYETLQEQSDWNSQVSFRSAASEDGTPSSFSRPQSTWESTDETPQSMATSDSSNPFRVQEPKPDVKPRRSLAANFQNAQGKSKEDGMIPDLKVNRNIKKTPSENPSTHLVISRFTSEFDSIERLGRGGFGRVYKARRKLEERFFAVKIVRFKEKARREVGALAEFQHPNIVRYYTAWTEPSEYKSDSSSESDSTSQSSSDSSAQYLYIQMELCDKKTLKVWIDEKNTQRRDHKRREEGLVIMKQIVNGVVYIHSKRLLHRDLKPANIMFGREGEVKIGDFGLVTTEDNESDENLIERTKRTGTKSYMAPEQKSHSTYDRKVDIFALGLIYFEVLCNISTHQERAKIWDDIRGQKLPTGFSLKFPQEHKLITSMLCAMPEDRPEASKVKTELELISLALDREHVMKLDNRTV
uniref:non-specific serine/threonine protein kinase n=2 Tax=Myripristis murdjan TaxID=586833 RepID=A0A668A7N9_9TELE